jgi:hypothetical protein
MINKEIYNTWTNFINDEQKLLLLPPKSPRPEQYKLRNYLINYKEHKCIICRIKKPVKLLQCAHLKPHCDIDDETKCDYNIVEFMCLECHKLYDEGDLGIDNGYLVVKDIHEYLQYEELQNKKIECYNDKNKIYFDYHFQHIYHK